jgi:hypothetical protein
MSHPSENAMTAAGPPAGHDNRVVPFELMEGVCAVLRRYADEREEARAKADDVYEADYVRPILDLARGSAHTPTALLGDGLWCTICEFLETDPDIEDGRCQTCGCTDGQHVAVKVVTA